MKRFSVLLAGALPVLMLGGCASSGGHEDYSSTTLHEEAPAASAFRSRNPAQIIDCSDSSLTTDSTPVNLAPHWEDGTFVPQFAANGGRATKQVLVNQVVSVKTPVSCTDQCQRWVNNPQSDGQGWDDYSSCNPTGGTGKSDLWNAFFGAPKADKAEKLDKAILGIGPTNAARLVDNNVFSSKPRSWSAFVNVMQNAQAQNILTPGIFKKVTSTYGVENMENLGYEPTSCTPVHHTDQQDSWTQVAYDCPGTRYGVQNQVISTAALPVTINVGPSRMQSFERDQVGVNVSYDGQYFMIRDAHASVLNYFDFSSAPAGIPGAIVNQPFSVQNGTPNANVFFTDRSRILVNLPSDIIGTAQLSSGVKSVIFTVPVNLGARQPSGPTDQLVVNYTVERCDMQGHWYTAGFRTCGSYYQIQAPTPKVLVDGPNLVQTIAADADHKIRVSYSIARHNSLYYNSRALPELPLVQKAHN